MIGMEFSRKRRADKARPSTSRARMYQIEPVMSILRDSIFGCDSRPICVRLAAFYIDFKVAMATQQEAQ